MVQDGRHGGASAFRLPDLPALMNAPWLPFSRRVECYREASSAMPGSRVSIRNFRQLTVPISVQG